MQVDEHSVFRHRGERKVKTVEDDAEEAAAKTAELLNEEGEELMGNKHRWFDVCRLCVTFRPCWPTLPPAAGDDSSDEGEDERDDSEVKEVTPDPEDDKDDTRDEESEEISFPDTTISLSHLQPNR